MPEPKTNQEPQVFVKSRFTRFSLIKINNKTTLIIFSLFVLVVIAVIFGALSGNPLKNLKKPPKDVNEPPIVNSENPSAFKYYPQGKNPQGLTGPDFREGSNAALKVELQRQGNKIILSWDPKVKTAVVQVFDLGKLYDLADHKKIWQIANYDLKNPSSGEAGKEIYINPPYEVGSIPSGFFLAEGFSKLEFAKGGRYSIELNALTNEGFPTLGTYTFTY